MINALMVSKTMKQKSKSQLRSRLSSALLILTLAVMTIGLAIPVRADQFDDQIAALQQQHAAKRNSLGALQAEARSYQEAINQLQLQIDALQSLIDANLQRQRELQAEIDKNEAELARQRQLLGQDIRTMYIDGQPTTIEILATSK